MFCYLQRQVKEDLAVPPTVSQFGSKKADNAGYVIPKGHLILACPGVSQVDPRIWKDANKWEPARWSDPEGVASKALDAYVNEGGEKIDYGWGAVSKGTESPYQPFGAGRHRCIGEQVCVLILLFEGCREELMNFACVFFLSVCVFAVGYYYCDVFAQARDQDRQLPCS